MLGMQLLFEHKPGPQYRLHSLPEGEWAGLGKNAKGPSLPARIWIHRPDKMNRGLAPAQP